MAKKKLATKKVVMTPDAAPTETIVLETEEGQPNIEVIVMQWWQQALIRASRTYVQTLLGLVSAAMVATGTGAAQAVGLNIAPGDFYNLFKTAALMSIAPAVLSLLQNAAEMLTSLDVIKPQLRA